MVDLIKTDLIEDKKANLNDVVIKYKYNDCIVFFVSLQKDSTDIAESCLVICRGSKLTLGQPVQYRMLAINGRPTKNFGILRVLNFAVVSNGSIVNYGVPYAKYVFDIKTKVRFYY